MAVVRPYLRNDNGGGTCSPLPVPVLCARGARSVGAMADEVIVHADHSMKTSRLSITIGIGGCIALLSAGAVYGSMNTRVSQLETAMHDRAAKSEVALMIAALDGRLGRIEGLLQRLTVTPGER